MYFGVFTMQQTATILLECAPDQPPDHPIELIAEESGLPCKQNMLADAAERLSEQDWTIFVQYAKRVDCFKHLYSDSVPIATLARSKIDSRLTLY